MRSSKKSKGAASGTLLKKPLVIGLLCAGIGYGAYSFWEANPNMQAAIAQYVDNGEIKTLEVRYTPEKIMELNHKELLSNNERTFQKADLQFYPHVLFNVKYTAPDKKTKEGTLLWSLVNGEMVVDCHNWETTHGFEDAINAQATRNDFKILNALEKSKGKMTIEQLQKELQLEQDVLVSLLENAKKKHLIVQKGNEIQLHFQNPRLLVVPQTKISQCIVSKPYNHSQKIARRYSPSQIEKISKAAFGQDFTIRTQEAIYLPIYSIDILNQDGSVRTAEFNAVTGNLIKSHYLDSAF